MRLAISLVLLWAQLALAAVSVSTVTTTADTDVSSLTVSGHVVSACAGLGGNQALLALIHQGNISGLTPVPTSVVWNGSEALAPKDTLFINQAAPGRVSIWFKTLPTATTANLVVTWPSNIRGVVGAMTLCSVDPTTPLGTSILQQTVVPDGMSDSVTVPTGGAAVNVFTMVHDSAVVVNGGTQAYNLTDVGGGSRGAASTRLTTGAMGWTWVTGFEYVGMITTPVNQAAAVVVGRRRVGGVFFP